MSAAAEPPELPDVETTGDEGTTLVSMLDFYRAVLVRKAWGLSDEQLATPLPPSDLTVGGLILHMALVEDHWFDHRFCGNAELEPWASAPWADDPDWELHTAHLWSHPELVAQYEQSVARSRSATASADALDRTAALEKPDGTTWNLRWILVHMIEEYARHCGHADFIRESIDGATGD